jgi:hypothetical protein
MAWAGSWLGSWLSAGWAALVTAVTALVSRLTPWLSSWTAEEVTAAGTVALAFLTLILALGTFFLWLATRRLVWGSEKTAEHQLRAYIFPEHVSVVAITYDPQVTLIFKNCGQTPAYDVAISSTTIVDVYPMLEEPQGLSDPPTVFMGHLGPDMRIRSEAVPNSPITSDEISAMQAGTAALCVFGAISYLDASKKRRFGTFCYFLTGPKYFRDGPMAIYELWNMAN